MYALVESNKDLAKMEELVEKLSKYPFRYGPDEDLADRIGIINDDGKSILTVGVRDRSTGRLVPYPITIKLAEAILLEVSQVN